MKPSRSLVRLFFAVSLVASASAAQAAANVTFVASNGSNANPCTRKAPCKTLQAAVDAVANAGQVQVLDTGFYGSFLNIEKSVTISAEGVTAILRAILINNGSARVILRGLLLSGAGTAAGTDGVRIVDANSVLIENCAIERFPRDGINSPDQTVKLSVKDSVARRNGRDGMRADGGGTTSVTVENSRFEANADDGIEIGDVEAAITNTILSGNADNGLVLIGGRANVARTVAADNGARGFRVQTAGGVLTIDSSISRGNATDGLSAGSGTKARITNSTFTNNNTGVFIGGVVDTRENNIIDGNDTDLAGDSLTPIDELEP